MLGLEGLSWVPHHQPPQPPTNPILAICTPRFAAKLIEGVLDFKVMIDK